MVALVLWCNRELGKTAIDAQQDKVLPSLGLVASSLAVRKFDS
jgi:hypothetical protein